MTKRLTVFLLALTVAIGILVIPASAASTITLRIFDNIPDRNSPWGTVIDTINKEFMRQHGNVKIVVESLPDQPYQEKMKVYAASNRMPDVFKYWSFATLLGELVNNKLAMPLNKKDYTKFNFVPGSLESNIYNGKLYGLPVTMDYWVVYYNKALFEKCNVKVPRTIEDLIAAAKVFRANGIMPVSTDGKDAWALCLTWDNLTGRVGGDFTVIKKAIDRKMKYTDPVFLTSAKKFKEMVDAGVFQDDLLTDDYDAAKNLFGQEKAAMYIMGAWEMGLGTNMAFSEHFRKNVGVFKFPVLRDGKGKVDDLLAWYGGNYVVNAKTKYKTLCLQYLQLYFKMYPTLIWKTKANVPAQKIKPLADDSQLAKDLLAIVADAKQTSGTGGLDLSTPEFKELHQKYIQDLAAGVKSPEEFCKALDEAAAKAAQK
ncbi:MAG: ABC transporter substrate-binding protein [Patescibacteria group bacterium]